MTIDLTWLGHSTVVLDVDGARLLTDPLLRRHVGLLRRRGASPPSELWENADAVLLSHLHHDHADRRSLALLPDRIPVIAAPDNVDWLRGRSLAGQSPAAGEWIRVPGSSTVSVTLCRAVHHSRPMPHRPNGATGHVIRSSAGAVWVAGDTSVFPGMELIPEQAGSPIELALVPISGWGPRLSAGHMGPWEAADACAMVGARCAVPVHWGTLHTPGGRNTPRGWMDRPAAVFTAAMAERAPACRVLVPRIGVRHRLTGPG
jgi:L-ascorbate metabolism protein UlaG (beta-lactamase superfamily)